MSAEPITLLLVGAPTSHLSMLRDASRLAWAGAQIDLVPVIRFEDALALPPATGAEIVVLWPGRPGDDARALAATDVQGLPRWGVVVVGAASEEPAVEVLAVDELEPRLVARALRSCLSLRKLRRELERERGDVWTLGRRLTHDLRNPLGCIVTTAEMMREMLAVESPEQAPYIETIVDGAAEMLELINRIHFMTKVSAQPRVPERIDMDGVRQAAVDRLQREITRRRAKVTAPESWPEVYGVRPWLEMVWGNFLANALRHTGESPRIEMKWQRERTAWRFEVCDDGPGVPSDRTGLLFVPFHRLHEQHGCGLGLSMVQRLVDLHGGRCGYEGGGGRGATFYFTLPLAEGDSPPDAVAATSTIGAAARQFAAEPRGAAFAAPTG